MTEPPNNCRITRKVRQWANPAMLAGKGINSSEIQGDALVYRCRWGRRQKPGRSRRDCLLRRIDEGGRGASEDGENGRTRKGHAALKELGRGEWCAVGIRPS